MRFLLRVKELAEQQHVSVEELATKARLSQTTIQYICDEGSVDTMYIRLLAKIAYDISQAHLSTANSKKATPGFFVGKQSHKGLLTEHCCNHRVS